MVGLTFCVPLFRQVSEETGRGYEETFSVLPSQGPKQFKSELSGHRLSASRTFLLLYVVEQRDKVVVQTLAVALLS